MAGGQAEERRARLPAPGVDAGVDGAEDARAGAVEALVHGEGGDLGGGGAHRPRKAGADAVLEDGAGGAGGGVRLAQDALAGESEDGEPAVDGGDGELGPGEEGRGAGDAARVEEGGLQQGLEVAGGEEVGRGGALQHDDAVERLEVLEADHLDAVLRAAVHDRTLGEQLLSEEPIQRPQMYLPAR